MFMTVTNSPPHKFHNAGTDALHSIQRVFQKGEYHVQQPFEWSDRSLVVNPCAGATTTITAVFDLAILPAHDQFNEDLCIMLIRPINK